MSLMELILENEKNTAKTIRLVASENLPNLEARVPYLLDMYARYSFSGEHDETTGFFPQYNLREIENETKRLLRECLGAKYVNIRPISGMNCMLIAIASFARKGSLVLSFDPLHGGHGETKKIFSTLGCEHLFLPFNKKKWQIDINAFKKFQRISEVKLVYLDLCMVLFPQPISELRELLPDNAIIVYDASHVLGLICGGLFQNPLGEGADLLIGSTHKTFPGPHKGIIATNRHLLSLKADIVSYHFASHHHVADVACLGLVIEKGKSFFKDYGTKIISNAQKLGAALSNRKVKVEFLEFNFTQTHQIWLDCGELKNVDRVTFQLSKLNIIVNSIKIPSLDGRWGIRIGVQEITHLGITAEGIGILAEIIADIIFDNESEDSLTIKKEILINHHFKDFHRNKSALNIIKEFVGNT